MEMNRIENFMKLIILLINLLKRAEYKALLKIEIQVILNLKQLK